MSGALYVGDRVESPTGITGTVVAVHPDLRVRWDDTAGTLRMPWSAVRKIERAILRAVQPPMWAGLPSPYDPTVMVCGSCVTPYICGRDDRCVRASDEDYEAAGYNPQHGLVGEADPY